MHQIQSRFHIEGYLETRIGGRTENQDACGFSDTELGALAIVCDGMGGMNGGSTASHLAVQTIIETVSSATQSDSPVEVITKAVNDANSAILNAGVDNPDLNGMGTTLTLLLINDDCAYATHVGDSRIYQLRSGKKVYRSFDHSVVFQLVKSGALSEEEARVAENSNIITKALGINSELEFEVIRLPYDKGDRFVLCTDGLWGPLPEVSFVKLLGNSREDSYIVLERAFNKIETAAKELRPTHYDNLTAAVLDVQHYSSIRSKMEKRFKILSGILSLLLLLSLGLAYRSYCSSNSVSRAIKYQENALLSKFKADSLHSVLNIHNNGATVDKKTNKAYKKAQKAAERDRKKAECAISASQEIINKVDTLKQILSQKSPINDTTKVNIKNPIN